MEDGSLYWEYVLLYTDVLVISHQAGERVLQPEIGRHFKLKELLIGPQDIYLGGKVGKSDIVSADGDVRAWSHNSSQYVQNAVSNVEKYLREVKHITMPYSMDAPITNGYRAKLDETAELEPDDVAYCQSFIGVLRWIVELGRLDIDCDVETD